MSDPVTDFLCTCTCSLQHRLHSRSGDAKRQRLAGVSASMLLCNCQADEFANLIEPIIILLDVAVQVSLLLRSISKGAPPPIPFAVVASVATSVLLIGWRSAFSALMPPPQVAFSLVYRQRPSFRVITMARDCSCLTPELRTAVLRKPPRFNSR